jgi:hypothetical protein
MSMTQLSAYKGVVYGFPFDGQKLFYLEIALFRKLGEPHSAVEDEILIALLKKVSDTHILVYTGDVEEEFEVCLKEMDTELEGEGLEYFLYTNMSRTLLPETDGMYQLSDGLLQAEIPGEEEQEKALPERSAELEDVLTYIKDHYLCIE